MKKTNFIKMLIMSTIMVGVVNATLFAKGWTTDGFEWFYYEEEGILSTETMKASGDDKYYLDSEGNMVRDYLLEGYNDSIYYFDDTGKMVKNTWVAVDPTQVANGMDNPPSIYLYYFGANGKAYKSNAGGVMRKSIDGKKYLFNENGQMLSGWINEQGERYNEFDTEEDPFVGYCYYAGDETDGVLREGWSEYVDGSVDDRYYLKQSLWFYFKPGDNKKVASENSSEFVKKKINGHSYGFDINGVMIQGWDSDMVNELQSTDLYFSEKEDDLGRMHKKEWIFAVPSEIQDSEDHDQEVSRWFYANSSGDIFKNLMRKINNKYYVFNKEGIMKHGLCIVDASTKEFVDCIDLEKTDGKDFIISRYYVSTETYDEKTGDDIYELFDDTKHKIYYFSVDDMEDDYGERKLGEVTVSFADADYTFDSIGTGEKEGEKYKKFYQAGIKLKADPILGLGLVFLGYSSDSSAAGVSISPMYNRSTNETASVDKNHNDNKSDYIVNMNKEGVYPVFAVVDANGNRINKSNVYKKDKSGNYWMIGANKTFAKCFDVPIKYVKNKKQWYYKSEKLNGSTGKTKTEWIPFRTAENEGTTSGDNSSANVWEDVYGRYCDARRDQHCEYEVAIDDLYGTNFRLAD